MRYLPVNLDVAGRKVLVVGGGRVASRKVKSLRECGAVVTVVSPAFCSGLARMKCIRRCQRGYRKSDLRGMWLVVSAAGPQAVNRRVWSQAQAAGIPVNVVDQPELCTFTVPAVLRHGDLLITISTGGGSPSLSGRIREILSAAIGPEFGQHLALLREMRVAVKASGLSLAARGALLKSMSAEAIRDRLRDEGVAAARRQLKGMLAEALRQSPGAVLQPEPDGSGGKRLRRVP